MTQPTLINLHPNEYSQESYYYPFAVKLDRCVGGCNILNDLSNKGCVSNKTKDLKSKFVQHDYKNKWMEKINKTYMSRECKCIFDGRKGYINQRWNTDECQCECKKHNICEKDYIWNPATCSCKDGKYLASIMHDSEIICDEIIDSFDEETKKSLFMKKYL